MGTERGPQRSQKHCCVACYVATCGLQLWTKMDLSRISSYEAVTSAKSGRLRYVEHSFHL